MPELKPGQLPSSAFPQALPEITPGQLPYEPGQTVDPTEFEQQLQAHADALNIDVKTFSKLLVEKRRQEVERMGQEFRKEEVEPGNLQGLELLGRFASGYIPGYNRLMDKVTQLASHGQLYSIEEAETFREAAKSKELGMQLLGGGAELAGFATGVPGKLLGLLGKTAPVVRAFASAGRVAPAASPVVKMLARGGAKALVGATEATVGGIPLIATEAAIESAFTGKPLLPTILQREKEQLPYWAGLGAVGGFASGAIGTALKERAWTKALREAPERNKLWDENMAYIENEARTEVAVLLKGRAWAEALMEDEARTGAAALVRARTEIPVPEAFEAVLQHQFNASVKRSVRTAGREATILAVTDTVPAPKGQTPLSPSEATARFSQLLDDMMVSPEPPLPKLSSLRDTLLRREASPLGKMAENETRRLMVEAKLAELGERGPLTSAELETLREALYKRVGGGPAGQGVLFEPVPEAELRVVTDRNKIAGQEVLFAPPKPGALRAVVPGIPGLRYPGPRPIPKAPDWIDTYVNPRTSGALTDAPVVTVTRPVRKGDAPRMAPQERADLHTTIDKNADEMIAARESIDPEFAAARAEVGPAERPIGGASGGLPTGYRVSGKDVNAAVDTVYVQLKNGVVNNRLITLIQDAIAEGYHITPGRLKLFQRDFPDVLKRIEAFRVAPEDLFEAALLTRDGQVRAVRLNGTDFAAAARKKEGEVGSFVDYERSPRASAVLTKAGITHVETSIGAAPETPAWPMRAAKWLGRKALRIPTIQPFRYFQTWKAPEMVEAMIDVIGYQGRGNNRALGAAIKLRNAFMKLTKEERAELAEMIYAQEKAKPGSSVAFTVDGHGGPKDAVGRMINDFNIQTLKEEASSRLAELGYGRLPPEQQLIMKKEAIAEIRRAQYLHRHIWEQGNITVQVKEFGTKRVLFRKNISNKKELARFLEDVEKDYGKTVMRDKAGKPVIFEWAPEDYIRHYKEAMDYDSLLNILQHTSGISAAAQEEMLVTAARGSGRIDLTGRKGVEGYRKDLEGLLDSMFKRYENAVHRGSMVVAREKIAKAMQIIPKDTLSYATEFRDALLHGTPDSMHSIKSGLYAMILGAKFTFYVQQFLQNTVYGYAHFLNTRTGLTFTQLASAVKKVSNPSGGLRFMKTGAMPTNYRLAMEQLEKDGLIKNSGFMTEHSTKGVGHLMQRRGPVYQATHYLQWLGERMEAGNRRNASLQSLALSFERDGLSVKDAILKAKLDVYNIHGMYDSINKLVLLSQLGKLNDGGKAVYMFQSFTANALAHLFSVYRIGGAGGSSGRAKLLQTLTLLAAGGTLGLPGAKAASWAWRKFNPESDPEGSMRTVATNMLDTVMQQMGISAEQAKKWGERGADVAMYGAPGAAGIDATVMLSLSNLPDPNYMDNPTSMIGVTANIARSEYRAIKLGLRGQYGRAVETGMPLSMLQRIMKGARWAIEGRATDSNGVPMLNEDGTVFKVPREGETPTTTTEGEFYARSTAAGLGLRNVKESRYQQKMAVRAAFNEAMGRRQESLYREVSLAVFNEDRAQYEKLVKGAQDLNGELRRRLAAGEELSSTPLRLDRNVIERRVMLLREGRNAALLRGRIEQIRALQQQKQR